MGFQNRDGVGIYVDPIIPYFTAAGAVRPLQPEEIPTPFSSALKQTRAILEIAMGLAKVDYNTGELFLECWGSPPRWDSADVVRLFRVEPLVVGSVCNEPEDYDCPGWLHNTDRAVGRCVFADSEIKCHCVKTAAAFSAGVPLKVKYIRQLRVAAQEVAQACDVMMPVWTREIVPSYSADGVEKQDGNFVVNESNDGLLRVSHLSDINNWVLANLDTIRYRVYTARVNIIHYALSDSLALPGSVVDLVQTLGEEQPLSYSAVSNLRVVGKDDRFSEFPETRASLQLSPESEVVLQLTGVADSYVSGYAVEALGITGVADLATEVASALIHSFSSSAILQTTTIQELLLTATASAAVGTSLLHPPVLSTSGLVVRLESSCTNALSIRAVANFRMKGESELTLRSQGAIDTYCEVNSALRITQVAAVMTSVNPAKVLATSAVALIKQTAAATQVLALSDSAADVINRASSLVLTPTEAVAYATSDTSQVLVGS